MRERGIATPSLDGLDPARPMIFVTAHRRENHGAMPEIARAVATIAGFPERPQILWPVHPSPQVHPIVHRVLDGVEGVRLVEPLNYAETVAAVAASHFVLTDSGGLQEEAPTLGKPVLVMRRETERPEGLEAGTLRLIGAEYAAIVEETRRLLIDRTPVRADGARLEPVRRRRGGRPDRALAAARAARRPGPGRVRAAGRRGMNGRPLVAAGGTFVGFVAGGFVLGLVLSNRTGASWWVIVGTFLGLFLGIGLFAFQIVRSVK